MANANYPISLDTATAKVNGIDLFTASLMNRLQEMTMELQKKAGVTSSQSSNSLDYKLTNNDDYFNSGLTIRGGRLNGARLDAAASGDTTVYTCPAGKRAAILSYTLRNNGAGNGNFSFKYAKSGGSTYKITSDTTLAAGGSSIGINIGFILNPGDAVVCAMTQTPYTLFIKVLEFDTTIPIQSQIVVGHSSGENTVYTCPAGKRALLLPITSLLWQPLDNTQPSNLALVQEIGTVTVTWYHVPSGGAAATNNIVASGAALSGARSLGGHLGAVLKAGEKIVVNTNQAGAASIAWANTYEFDV